MRCIETPDIGYLVVWGVSDNTRSYWDNTGAERLGYRPMQNSEDYAADVLSRPTARPDRTALSGWRVRHPGLHACGSKARLMGQLSSGTREKLKAVSTATLEAASSSGACATSSSRMCIR